MKERPIIFSGPMVRAILEGRKTQTRRVVKLRDFGPSDSPVDDWDFRDKRGRWNSIPTKRLLELCPCGQPGDRLWVKETFWAWGTWEEYQDDTGKTRHRFVDHTDNAHPIIYAATQRGRFYTGPANGGNDYHKRPSIFMSRIYSRIDLEATETRVELVQEISYQDSIQEGIQRTFSIGPMRAVGWKDYLEGGWLLSPTDSFKSLWDSINAKRGYSWESNTPVWVIEFRRV